LNQITRTKPFKNWQELKEYTDQRRVQLNNHIICDSLGKPPLVAFPKAKHSLNFFNPLQEKEMINLNFIYEYLHKKEWFRKISTSQCISLGSQSYYIPKSIPNQQIKITFEKESKMLFFHNDKELLAQLPIKGIDAVTLMGDESINACPNAQIPIPWDWKNIKISTTF
jgi:hypothetical protein